jgi:spermidine synthase
MARKLRKTDAGDGRPFVFQERGEVSLHFGMGAVQSRMRVAAPDKLVLDYTRSMMAFLLLNPRPRRIVMLGLGGGSLAKYCHANLPQTAFTTLEISPEVIALREFFSIPRDDERFEVICADGAAWLREHPACCDVLMLDGFDTDGLPEALSSQDFFDACAEALQPGGVLVSNLWARASLREAIVERLRRSFESGVLTLLAEDGENTIALACRGEMPTPRQLRERARELGPLHPVDLEISATALAQALGGDAAAA